MTTFRPPPTFIMVVKVLLCVIQWETLKKEILDESEPLYNDQSLITSVEVKHNSW